MFIGPNPKDVIKFKPIHPDGLVCRECWKPLTIEYWVRTYWRIKRGNEIFYLCDRCYQELNSGSK